MNDIDARIRAALVAAATQVTDDDLYPAAAPGPARRRVARWVTPALAAATVVAVAVTAGIVIAAQNAAGPTRVQPGAGPTSTGSSTDQAQVPVSTTIAASRAPAKSSPTAVKGGMTCFFADVGCVATSGYVFYEPIWPFTSYAQAQVWENVDGPAGHSPWHADAAATALAFVSGYLHFGDVTTVTSSVISTDQAHIGVGYRLPGGGTHTSAVLHLVRYSVRLGDAAAGWEVVGSDDTTLTLEQPAYGSRLPSTTVTITAGGHVTGVDENIVVAVRNQAGAVVSTPVPGVAGGGTKTAWAAQVPVTGSGVLTVIAFTGGHLAQHERFAIQGVHT